MLADCCRFHILKVQCAVHPSSYPDPSFCTLPIWFFLLILLCATLRGLDRCQSHSLNQLWNVKDRNGRQYWMYSSPEACYLYLFIPNFFIARSLWCMKCHDYFYWCLAIPLSFNYWIRGRHWGWTRDFCHFFSKCLTSQRVQIQTAAVKPMQSLPLRRKFLLFSLIQGIADWQWCYLLSQELEQKIKCFSSIFRHLFLFTSCSELFSKCRYLLVKIPGGFSPPSCSVGKNVEVYTHHNILVPLLPWP